MEVKAFTGHSRRKSTSWTVRAADVVSGFVITIGGIGTIVAVSLVFISLFVVVAPLFFPASIAAPRQQPLAAPSGTDVLQVTLDEYRTMGWLLSSDGHLSVFQLETGETVSEQRLFDGDTQITASSFTVAEPSIAIGFEDGSVRLGRITFDERYFELADVPDSFHALPAGGTEMWKGGVVQRTPQGQFRLQTVEVKFGEPVSLASSPILRLDHIPPEDDDLLLAAAEYYVAFYTADGELKAGILTEAFNALTGERTLDTNLHSLPLENQHEQPPFRVLLTSGGDNVYVVWEDGLLLRFDIRRFSDISLAQRLNVVSREGAQLTVCQFLIGRDTLLCGDSTGDLSAWFRIRHDREIAGDGLDLIRVHRLASGGAAIRSLGASERSRMVAAGYDDGSLRVFHVTTNHVLLAREIAPRQAVELAGIAPKDDGLFALVHGQLWQADFDPAHPEATWSSLFRPVWYEGHERPKHIWQSSFATSAPEMKLGLWPLVFGTLKATVYTMLFGAPLALLAAIYTSEFMHSRTRARVKPVVEVMASLPSVVLGFLAALVFAPIVEQIVPAVLAAFLTIPVCFLIGAFLWQLAPRSWMLMVQAYRLWVLFLPLAAGIWLAFRLSPVMEAWFFAGDIKRWLDGQIGTGVGAWMLTMVPLCSVATALFVFTVVNPRMRRAAEGMGRIQFASLNAAKFLAALLVALGLAYLVSLLLTAIGLDPRGGYVATYQQRNALVVGFVMGFAVIPIIYTIADDALSTVPNHLRSASLACGATHWQTAVRVVVPTAMSGLFSALMIGLGRAVGETMIVLMAGGNTPVTDWNIFSGFRTLSANIAVELPEAVRNSTHYRTLFLAALTLFVMTFVVNTLAEVVRLRFRRRAYQL